MDLTVDEAQAGYCDSIEVTLHPVGPGQGVEAIGEGVLVRLKACEFLCDAEVATGSREGC